MKTLLRLVMIGFAVGALVALLATRRGQDVRDTVSSAARSALDAAGVRSAAPGQGGSLTDDGDLQARIEETRRRLRAELTGEPIEEGFSAGA